MTYWKKGSEFYLKIAFSIFLAGAILRIVGISEIAEFLLRISFIFWLAGLFIAIKEIK